MRSKLQKGLGIFLFSAAMVSFSWSQRVCAQGEEVYEASVPETRSIESGALWSEPLERSSLLTNQSRSLKSWEDLHKRHDERINDWINRQKNWEELHQKRIETLRDFNNMVNEGVNHAIENGKGLEDLKSRQLDTLLKAKQVLPVVWEARKDAWQVSGKAYGNAPIVIYDEQGQIIGTGTAAADGTFTCQLFRPLRGAERIKIVCGENKDSSIFYVIGQEENSSKGDVSTLQQRIAYVKGYPDGTFRPSQNVTRSEAAMMFATLVKGSNFFDQTYETPFRDANGQWYSSAVNYVVNRGFLQGYPDGTFRPQNNMTRGEFAQMVRGYLSDQSTAKVQFSDTRGHWAQKSIEEIAGMGIIQGYPDGNFQPNRAITRAEAVAILNASFGRNTKQQSLEGSHYQVKTFSDVPRSHWAYYFIIDASTNHKSYVQNSQNPVDIWVD